MLAAPLAPNGSVRRGTIWLAASADSPAGEGKFFFTMMAAFAELERDMIHERTMAGLAAARAQGRNGGRPTVMDRQARRGQGSP